jgi:hypothetical protein
LAWILIYGQHSIEASVTFEHHLLFAQLGHDQYPPGLSRLRRDGVVSVDAAAKAGPATLSEPSAKTIRRAHAVQPVAAMAFVRGPGTDSED